MMDYNGLKAVIMFY